MWCHGHKSPAAVQNWITNTSSMRYLFYVWVYCIVFVQNVITRNIHATHASISDAAIILQRHTKAGFSLIPLAASTSLRSTSSALVTSVAGRMLLSPDFAFVWLLSTSAYFGEVKSEFSFLKGEAVFGRVSELRDKHCLSSSVAEMCMSSVLSMSKLPASVAASVVVVAAVAASAAPTSCYERIDHVVGVSMDVGRGGVAITVAFLFFQHVIQHA